MIKYTGLTADDRNLIENLFRSGFLRILVSTTTLALGVNLPAHLVIIKSTTHMVAGAYKEIEEHQVCNYLKILSSKERINCYIVNVTFQ
jgi:ATP-dependent DNA helicase HFM1/MER3